MRNAHGKRQKAGKEPRKTTCHRSRKGSGKKGRSGQQKRKKHQPIVEKREKGGAYQTTQKQKEGGPGAKTGEVHPIPKTLNSFKK